MDMTVADMLVAIGAPGRNSPPAVRWLASWLPDADHRWLDRSDIERIDAHDPSRSPHQLLASVLPLARPVWFEATIVTRPMSFDQDGKLVIADGALITTCWGAVPAADGLDIGWTSYTPSRRRMVGPLGPARVAADGMQRPPDTNDDVWYELTQAAGVVMRALLLGVGKPEPAPPFDNF
jgi:hypothetical protein